MELIVGLISHVRIPAEITCYVWKKKKKPTAHVANRQFAKFSVTISALKLDE
jgi:hypothetical protein